VHGPKFSAYRSRLQDYQAIGSFPHKRIDEMLCKLDSSENPFLFEIYIQIYMNAVSLKTGFGRKIRRQSPPRSGIVFQRIEFVHGPKFSAYRSRLQDYQAIGSFPHKRIDEMLCKLDSSENSSLFDPALPQ